MNRIQSIVIPALTSAAVSAAMLIGGSFLNISQIQASPIAQVQAAEPVHASIVAADPLAPFSPENFIPPY